MEHSSGWQILIVLASLLLGLAFLRYSVVTMTLAGVVLVYAGAMAAGLGGAGLGGIIGFSSGVSLAGTGIGLMAAAAIVRAIERLGSHPPRD